MASNSLVDGTTLPTANKVDVRAKPAGAAASGYLVASELNPMIEVLTDLRTRAGDAFNVANYSTTAINDGVADASEAVLAAVAAAVAAGGGRVYFPRGTYLMDEAISCATSGVHFVGDGPGATTVKAAASFPDSALFILGNKAEAAVTVNMQLAGMTLNCGEQGVTGLEVYGLRDGSAVRDVYVTRLLSVPGIIVGQGGAGAGVATSYMCEGVMWQNVHVITGQNLAFTGTEGFRIDGIFESTFLGCTVRGSGTADMGGSAGFRIGSVAEVRGVSLLNCAAVYLKDLTITEGVPDEPSYGIHYGGWARECWDAFSTFEEIAGSAVRYHGGTASGTLLPSNVQTIAPRLYRDTDPELLNPAFLFGDAAQCRAELRYYRTDKVWARFETPVTTQTNNVLAFEGEVAPSGLGDVIEFGGGAQTTNRAEGWTSDGTAIKHRALYTSAGVVGIERNVAQFAVVTGNQTLTPGADAIVNHWSAALTANVTVTLDTTGAVKGDRFRVVRSGLGAFTLDVGGLKTIPSATAAWVDVQYSGSAWVLTGYGAL